MILRFAHPAALLLLVLPVIVAVLVRFNRLALGGPTILFSDVRLLDHLPIGWRVRVRRLPDVLRFLAWGLLVVGLARPQSGRTQEIIRGQGIDIVLALDISGSMAALDFAPQNRLETAKSVIGDFVSGREFDHIGLVVFAQDAFQQTPPTLDYKTLLRSLDGVQLATNLALSDGTAIGMGLASSANMLRSSTAVTKVIILLTDGANNAGEIGPITAAQAAATLGMRVYTIGMGKTGLVPMPDGQVVESNVDEATLQTIADTTHGRYFRAEDLTDLHSIYDEINRLERSDVERQILTSWQDQGFILLGAGLLLLTAEWFIRHSVLQIVP